MRFRRTLAIIGAVIALVLAGVWIWQPVASSEQKAVTEAPVDVQATTQDPTLAHAAIPRTKPDIGQLYIGVNTERVKAGLDPLAVSPLLEASACAKADDMIAKDYWSHDAPDGTPPWHYFDLAGYSYTRAGENQAYGHPDSASAITGWVGSPTHRANVLGDFTQMGICVTDFVDYQGGSYSVIVNHFGYPRN